MVRLHFAAALFTLALLSLACAEDKMENRTFWSNPTELGATNDKLETLGPVLPPTSRGEQRYDVMKFLEANGVERQPGLCAVFVPATHQVVVHAPPKVLALLDRIFMGEDWYPPQQIELCACLWTYVTDAPLDPAAQPRTLAELRALAGKSLRLVDSNSVVTKSGNRVKHEHRLALPTVSASPAPPPPPTSADTKDHPKAGTPPAADTSDDAPGSTFEVEPNIDPDDLSIALSLAYHARVPRPAGPPDEFIDTTSDITISSGATVIVFRNIDPSATPDGKLTPYALTISPQIINARGHTKAQWREDEAADQKLSEFDRQGFIRRALEGLVHE